MAEGERREKRGGKTRKDLEVGVTTQDTKYLFNIVFSGTTIKRFELYDERPYGKSYFKTI